MSAGGRAIRLSLHRDPDRIVYTKGARAFIHVTGAGRGDVYCLPGDDPIGKVTRVRQKPHEFKWIAHIGTKTVGWARTRIKAAEILADLHHGRGD